MALSKTKSDSTNEIQAILHKLAKKLGYSSLKQLILNYQKPLQKTTQPEIKTLYLDFQVKRVVESLDEAQKCLNSEFYSQTFVTCDQIIQQLLMTLLGFFKINLEKKSNEMKTVLTALHNHGIHIKSEQKLRWLRYTRNLIRYKKNAPTSKKLNKRSIQRNFLLLK